jgi:hypothetical protein
MSRSILRYAGGGRMLEDVPFTIPLYDGQRERYSNNNMFSPPGSSSLPSGGRLTGEDLAMIAEVFAQLDAVQWARKKMMEEACTPDAAAAPPVAKFGRAARDREVYNRRAEAMRDPGGRSSYGMTQE